MCPAPWHARTHARTHANTWPRQPAGTCHCMRPREHQPTWVSRVLQKQTNVVRFLFEHARTHEPPLLQILPRAFLCYPHIFSSCHVVPPVTIASDVAVLFDLRAFPFLISAIVRTAPPALAMVQAHPDLTTYPCGAKRGEAKRRDWFQRNLPPILTKVEARHMLPDPSEGHVLLWCERKGKDACSDEDRHRERGVTSMGPGTGTHSRPPFSASGR